MFKLFNRIINGRSRNQEEEFWNWFLMNKNKLEKFVDSNHEDYSIYNSLTKKIKKYHPVLYPELTKNRNEEFVLIITPDGKSEGIIPTKKLAENKPEIKNWVVKKFRQPNDEITLNFDGIEYKSSDIEIAPQIVNDEDKVDIQVFIRNMNKDEKRYQSLAFLYLDHILGEFNTITKVRFIDFYNLEDGKSVENGISILELRKLIEEQLY